MTMKIRLIALTMVTAALALSGCSFSDSSKIGSDSSKSIIDSASYSFNSSSDSSRTRQENYQNDVSEYTTEYVRSSHGTINDFLDHLGEMAQNRGITNWESDRSTYLGIGRGLKKANLGTPQTSAFIDSFSGNDPTKKQTIIDGFNR